MNRQNEITSVTPLLTKDGRFDTVMTPCFDSVTDMMGVQTCQNERPSGARNLERQSGARQRRGY